MQGEIDLYRSRFQSDLAAYHLQRAWQVMLVCRKAYSLFHRSKTRFIAWAMLASPSALA